MQIDHHKCVACANCISVCPMGAIYIDPAVNRATVNLDECVECFACYRGMSKEHLNPRLVRTIRGLPEAPAHPVRSGAGRLPHGRPHADRN